MSELQAAKDEVILRFTTGDFHWLIVVVDERPEVDVDPTVCIYRDDEEEPVATIHLDHEAACTERSHTIVRTPELVEEH